MTKHLSVRVPWHDNNWNGSICSFPNRNNSCRILKNIAIAKHKEDSCQMNNNCPVSSNNQAPCTRESGMFMSDHKIQLSSHHPYTFDPHYRHILDTDHYNTPYSFLGISYRWLLKDNDNQENSLHNFYLTHYDPNIEKINTSWISNGINQKNIFEYFYNDIIPQKSMVVAYAKTIPFIESPGRILVALGHILNISPLEEYEYSEKPDNENRLSSYLWERNIEHSIRQNRENGFIFPFKEIENYLKENPQQNPEELFVIIPYEFYDDYSYATEHLSHDTLIYTLSKTIQVLKKYIEIKLPDQSGASWQYCIKWCEEKIKEIWIDRGIYPGLGTILCALGLPYGYDIASKIKAKHSDNELWDNVITELSNKKLLQVKVNQSRVDDICYELEEKLDYIKLLSRINLSLSQAQLLLKINIPSYQKKYINLLTDILEEDLEQKIIDNPYLLYEKTYQLEEQYKIGIHQIDLALFVPEHIQSQYADEDILFIDDPENKQRLRAITLSFLEEETQKGNSLMLLSDAVSTINNFRMDISNIGQSVRSITFKRLKEFFSEVFTQLDVALISDTTSQKETALQLNRLIENKNLINTIITAKLKKELSLTDNWEQNLREALKNNDKGEDFSEKITVLKKMAASPISILTGGAGTGKTTTIAALCQNMQIQQGRILILTPTGKARIVLSNKLTESGIKHTAKTVFQYLLETDHCNTSTWSYYLSGKIDKNIPETVIIDECSMLTEEMFGALLESVQKAKRIIFVGDPNQLPPIGTGKPFYELAQKLKQQENQPHYACLTVSNRQKSKNSQQRLDVILSKLFTEDLQHQVDENIFSNQNNTDNFEYIYCDNAENLENILLDVLKKIGINTPDSFNQLFGGKIENGWMNYYNSSQIETWQILSSYKNKEIIGSRAINSFIQNEFIKKAPENTTCQRRVTRTPLGIDEICYGEKVINTLNHKAQYTLKDQTEKDECIISNGELGLVIKLHDEQRGRIKKTKGHIIEFTSQNDRTFYFKSEISEDCPLELAYALTVHKSQGSGFKNTIFVLIEPDKGANPFVTREMLYTALTRQEEKVFLIYNKPFSELKKYTNVEFSDLALRKTNLFTELELEGLQKNENSIPTFYNIKSKWYDEKLIHKTKDGTLVRSKSEVIIYNELLTSHVDFNYEKELVLSEQNKLLPDFTIETPKGIVYWEHLGMLNDIDYKNRWEHKKLLYKQIGISEKNENLIITEDDVYGGIDSEKIVTIIHNKLL